MTTVTATTAAPARTLSIVALVLGLVSVVTGFQLVFGVAAVVVGILALRQETAGKALAVWGIVTGSLSVLGLVWGTFITLALLPVLGIAALGGYLG